MAELDFTVYDYKQAGRTFSTDITVPEAVGSLGIPTAPPFGFTVAIPTGHLIAEHLFSRSVDNKSTKRHYQELNPSQQISWLMKEYVPRVVAPYVDRALIVCELTKSDNIHLHMICWDPSVRTDWDMAWLRKTVNNTVLCRSILKGKYDHARILNCIHFLSEDKGGIKQWTEYLSKDQNSIKYILTPSGYRWDERERMCAVSVRDERAASICSRERAGSPSRDPNKK